MPAAPSSVVKTNNEMRKLHRRKPQRQLSMKKSAVRFLILTGLFQVALCDRLGHNICIYKKKTWSEARKYCRDQHTDLSSLNNHWENDRLLKKWGNFSHFKAWIGLYKDDNDTWKWSGGKNASFFKWSRQKSTSNRCVALDNTGWQKMNCEENKLDFCCFKSSLVLVKENMTWEEAMMQCHHQQSNLVSVDSESALMKTLQASREAQTDRMWIGLRYLADNWLWEKGNKMKYKAWSQSKEPECPAWSHRCGVLSLRDHHWDSWDCLDKLYFACN